METSQPNDEQSRAVERPVGRAWVDTQAPIDRMFEPLEKLLVDAAATSSARSVLDVGCGTARSRSRAAARGGRAMHGHRYLVPDDRRRAGRAAQRSRRFVRADVQTHAFGASVDLIVSRLGVMFFDDPVRAFANLRHAARPNAQMRFIAWRSAADNPFDDRAGRRACCRTCPPGGPARRGNSRSATGSALRRCCRTAAGRTSRSSRSIWRARCLLPRWTTYIAAGPVGLALLEVDEATRRRVVDTMRAAFAPYVEVPMCASTRHAGS